MSPAAGRVCPSPRKSDRGLALEETAAGRFDPSYGVAAPEQPFGCFRCWELPDACLEVLAARDASEVYADARSNRLGVKLYPKGARPFRLHVAGLSPSALHARLQRLLPYVKDPLYSEVLRHVDVDVTWADRTNGSRPWPLFPRGGGNATPPGQRGGDDELVMIWPMWEKGAHARPARSRPGALPWCFALVISPVLRPRAPLIVQCVPASPRVLLVRAQGTATSSRTRCCRLASCSAAARRRDMWASRACVTRRSSRHSARRPRPSAPLSVPTHRRCRAALRAAGALSASVHPRFRSR